MLCDSLGQWTATACNIIVICCSDVRFHFVLTFNLLIAKAKETNVVRARHTCAMHSSSIKMLVSHRLYVQRYTFNFITRHN